MTATCTNCGQPIRPSAKFCAKCGHVQEAALPPQVAPPPPPQAQAQPPTPPPTPPEPVCINCQQPLRAGSRFCARCGADQLAPPPVAPAVPVSPTPAVSAPPPPPPPPPSPPTLAASGGSIGYVLRNGLLIAGLALGLLAALFFTYQSGEQVAAIPTASPTATPPPPMLTPEVLLPTATPTAMASQAVVAIGFKEDGRFGLVSTTGNPATDSDDDKNLTFNRAGSTSNTRIWIDGETPIYGTSGRISLGETSFSQSPTEQDGKVVSIWQAGDVEVAQRLSYVHGTNTGRVDTIRIEYSLTNRGAASHEVGLRMMIDTLIGRNDGVPFVAPGHTGIIDKSIAMRGGDVPDYLQALEQANLAVPGVIVQMTLRGADATPPDRLVISAWSGSDVGWDTYLEAGGDGHALCRGGLSSCTPDSQVLLYFNPQPLAPGATRTLIAYYGLGGISSTESGNSLLSLTVPKEVKQGEAFWVVALVVGTKEGQRVRLELPDGLVLIDGFQAEQPLEAGKDFTQISWRVEAKQPGSGDLTVTLQPDGVSETQSISVPVPPTPTSESIVRP